MINLPYCIMLELFVINDYYVNTVLTTFYTMMFHTYFTEISAALSTAPSYSDFRVTTFIDDDESNSLINQI